jgi:hypothetical protein
MVLLGDEARVGAHFGLFGESANLDTREVHGLRRMYHIIKNPFGRTQWNSSLCGSSGISFQSVYRQC